MKTFLMVPLAVAYGALLVLSSPVSAQVAGTPAVATPAGPADASPETRAILKMLEERKTTLKDFTGKIDYSVENGRTGDVTGKRGTVDFLNDPAKGPIFSANFTTNTVDGTPKLLYNVQFIFDGRDFTIKDIGTPGKEIKQYVRTTVLPEGAKPGDAATLNGAVTLPIGLNTEDVIRTFEVTSSPAKDPNQVILKIVPREKTKYDYAKLEVTVDKRPEMQVPVKLSQTANSGDITSLTLTITPTDINTGKAKLLDSATPASEGWVDRAGGAGK